MSTVPMSSVPTLVNVMISAGAIFNILSTRATHKNIKKSKTYTIIQRTEEKKKLRRFLFSFFFFFFFLFFFFHDVYTTYFQYFWWFCQMIDPTLEYRSPNLLSQSVPGLRKIQKYDKNFNYLIYEKMRKYKTQIIYILLLLICVICFVLLFICVIYFFSF